MTDTPHPEVSTAQEAAERYQRRNKMLNGIPAGEKDFLRMRLSKQIHLNGECWEFTGSHNVKGYGTISIKGHLVLAHRAAYALWAGPLTDGLQLDHLCVNPPCINPGHLEEVSLGENVLRGSGISASNKRKERCPKCGGEYYFEKKRPFRKCRACQNISLQQRRRLRRIAELLRKEKS